MRNACELEWRRKGRGSLGNSCSGCHVNKLSLKEESPLEVEVIKTRVHVDKLNWSYPLFHTVQNRM